MQNQLQRYSMANDGTFTINVIGARPFMLIAAYNFEFLVGDLVVTKAKKIPAVGSADFDSSYSFKSPITDPIRAAHDLMTADRFADDWLQPMLKSLVALFNEGDTDLESFAREFGLKDLQAYDTNEPSAKKANIILTGKF